MHIWQFYFKADLGYPIVAPVHIGGNYSDFTNQPLILLKSVCLVNKLVNALCVNYKAFSSLHYLTCKDLAIKLL